MVCVFSLLVPAAVLAKGGPPDDSGYGGGGEISDEGVLYGDLYVVLRDDNGVPIPDLNNNDCPTPVFIDADGICQGITMAYDDETFKCEVPGDFADLVVPVESGRLSVSRTTDSVLEHAYIEAIKNISYADSIAFDPAFRLLLTFKIFDEDGVEVSREEKTIDSPLENVAMYQTLLTWGYFPRATVTSSDPNDTSETVYDPSANLVANSMAYLAYRDDVDVAADGTYGTWGIPGILLDMQKEDLQAATSFIAAGASKAGRITLDMLININANLGLNGEVEDMEYFDFRNFENTYMHQHRYGDVEDVDLLVGPEEGFPEGETWFQVWPRNILSEVPFETVLTCKQDPSMLYTINVIGPSGPSGFADHFTQAADDARAVIEFLHNWSIPEYVIPE